MNTFIKNTSVNSFKFAAWPEKLGRKESTFQQKSSLQQCEVEILIGISICKYIFEMANKFDKAECMGNIWAYPGILFLCHYNSCLHFIYIQSTAHSKIFHILHTKANKVIIELRRLTKMRRVCAVPTSVIARELSSDELCWNIISCIMTIKPSPYFKLQLCFPLAPVKYSASMNLCMRSKICTFLLKKNPYPTNRTLFYLKACGRSINIFLLKNKMQMVKIV